MKFATSIVLAAQVLTVLAAPQLEAFRQRNRASATSSAAAVATSAAAEAGGEGEGEENEVEQQGQFGVEIALGGGDVKTDTLFPPGVRYFLISEIPAKPGS